MFRLFLLLLLVANSNMSLLAQLIEPVLQTGHKQDITLVDVAFEKSVYLTGNKTELILWNSRNGWQLRKIAPGLAIIGASFTNDGNEIAVMCYEYGKISALLFYDVASGAFKDSVSFEETQMWGKRYPPLDELIVSADRTTMMLRSFDKIFLVNCLSRSLTGHFKIPSYDSRLAFINDSTAMVASGDNKTIVQQLRLPQGEILATKELHSSASPLAVKAYTNGILVLLKNKKLLQLDEMWQPKEEIALPENTSVSSYK
ncbi:MAG TPA: hypothetical protein VLL95_13115, partial [Phnomibacter sp.]|nr:hypothetical protein [Phnomibacter sp.]